jgi:hypothetical protein
MKRLDLKKNYYHETTLPPIKSKYIIDSQLHYDSSIKVPIVFNGLGLEAHNIRVAPKQFQTKKIVSKKPYNLQPFQTISQIEQPTKHLAVEYGATADDTDSDAHLTCHAIQSHHHFHLFQKEKLQKYLKKEAPRKIENNDNQSIRGVFYQNYEIPIKGKTANSFPNQRISLLLQKSKNSKKRLKFTSLPALSSSILTLS